MADYISTLTGQEIDAALQDMAMHNSEAYAIGERAGVIVTSGDPCYQNNAKYYCAQAQSIAPASVTEAVRWDIAQTALNEAQRAQARANIDAGKNGAWVNPNLLDNAWFAGGGGLGVLPINQRGRTTYSSEGYAIDRWALWNNAGTLTFSTGYMTFAAGGANAYLQQKLETPIEGTYTLSAIVSGTGQCRLYFADANFTTLASQTYSISGETIISLVFRTEDTPIGGIRLRVDANNSVNWIVAKLEAEDLSTIDNEVAPNYTLELLKCQRYYHIYGTQAARPSNQYDCVPHMYSAPTQGTVTIGGTTYYYNAADL